MLVSKLAKREDQALILISTILKFPAQDIPVFSLTIYLLFFTSKKKFSEINTFQARKNYNSFHIVNRCELDMPLSTPGPVPYKTRFRRVVLLDECAGNVS